MNPQKPLAFRGVFVFTTAGKMTFSQRFSTVEAMVPAEQPKLPSNKALEDFFKLEIVPSLSASSERYTFEMSPEIVLAVLPVKNFVLSVVPFLESRSTPKIELSGAFSFLVFFETISRSLLRPITSESPASAYAQLRQLVTQIMPFGSPIIHDAFFASQLTAVGDLRRFSAGYQTVAPAPIPSWKTSLLFPRPQVELKLREVVMGSIDGVNNTFDVYGELRCVAQVSYLPDITVKVSGLEQSECLSGHFCVKKIEGNQIVFSPPTGISQLLMWKAKVDHKSPPVDGTYGIREDENGLHFSLTISVHPPVKSVVAQLPFPGRGCLTKHQFQNPGGQLKMSKKEATVMWIVKLGENGTMTLTGVLGFENKPQHPEKCRAFVTLKSKKKSFTGASIDKDSVTFSSSANFSVTTETSYATESKKYIFWETPLSD